MIDDRRDIDGAIYIEFSLSVSHACGRDARRAADASSGRYGARLKARAILVREGDG